MMASLPLRTRRELINPPSRCCTQPIRRRVCCSEVVGGGLEYAVAGPWSVKAEYLYYGLGDESYSGINADLKIHTAKLGLNYRF
jgi:hypothetical protein